MNSGISSGGAQSGNFPTHELSQGLIEIVLNGGNVFLPLKTEIVRSVVLDGGFVIIHFMKEPNIFLSKRDALIVNKINIQKKAFVS